MTASKRAPDEAVASPADVLERANARAQELGELEDFYFARDKESKRKELCASIDAPMKSLLQDAGRDLSAGDRAKAFYLQGKVACASPSAANSKAAEALFSKAAKLDPGLSGAWTSLGELYYERKEMAQARRCFEQALEYGESEDKAGKADALRKLSMVLRALDDAEARAENYTLALAKAKEATVIDPQEGLSWEVLGNSYFGDFFVNGTMRPEVISKSLIAFERAATCFTKQGKESPFLYYNWGIALKFMESYELAIQTFRKAVAISEEATPSLREIKQITETVTQVADLVRKQGNLKAKRLGSITSSISPTSGVSLLELKPGENKDTVLAAKVVSVVSRESEIPIILICCDATACFFALSVYNCDLAALTAAVNPGETSLSIRSPLLRQMQITVANGNGDGNLVSYPCVRAAHPGDLLIPGGGNLGSAACVSAFKTDTSFDGAGTSGGS